VVQPGAKDGARVLRLRPAHQAPEPPLHALPLAFLQGLDNRVAAGEVAIERHGRNAKAAGDGSRADAAEALVQQDVMCRLQDLVTSRRALLFGQPGPGHGASLERNPPLRRYLVSRTPYILPLGAKRVKPRRGRVSAGKGERAPVTPQAPAVPGQCSEELRPTRRPVSRGLPSWSER